MQDCHFNIMKDQGNLRPRKFGALYSYTQHISESVHALHSFIATGYML